MKPSTLVLRNITRRRSRFAFTLLGITVGIGSLVTLLALGTGLEKAESGFHGLAGGLLGVVDGFLFSYAAAPYISQNEFTAFLGSEQTVRLFDPLITAEALVFSVGVSVLSGIYPAWKASRLSPVEAIRYE